MSVDVEDEFQKELIEVFVQEAQEWLEQIHVALDELQQGPDPDHRLKLVQTIKAGLANLGGSAATVSLTEIAQATFATLQLIEPLHDPVKTLSADDFVALCKQLGHINTALAWATPSPVVVEEKVVNPQQRPTSAAIQELLAALHQLQARQAKSGLVQRNVIQPIIAQVEKLACSGVEECDVAAMRESLVQAGAGEDRFLTLLEQRIPTLLEELGRLKHGAASTGPASERLKIVVEQVRQLWSIAQQVNASQAMTFFKGLHSFLTLIMQQRVVVAANRYEAVEARLAEMAKAIQRWVETGRAERSAISGLFVV